ncbi:MAG: hypothetical protein HC788_09095 [Sphingopyxis sp.]|nr:hypothetical protein [Sphingopyxis sp.]
MRTDIAAAQDCWLLGGSEGDAVHAAALLRDWSAPRFPLKGGMLVARGIGAGPEVARLLQEIEGRWVASNFPDGAVLAALVDQTVADARQ